MGMGVLMGKRYNLKKVVNVSIITAGVAMFMLGKRRKGRGEVTTTLTGLVLLFLSLCFDGASESDCPTKSR
jgi:solute carrier family 35 (UDP-galactose transporter), member B1